MEIKGTAFIIGSEITKGEKFKYRELIVKTNGKYPQFINIQFTNDRIDLIDHIKEGQEITVSINIRGREYNGKYYNQLEGWKVAIDSQVKEEPKKQVEEVAGRAEDDLNDLPF